MLNRKNWIFVCLVSLLLVTYSQSVYASPNEADYETSINSKHVYEYPNDEGFSTWEIILNISGPTPNSTMQDYNISLDFIASGSQEGVQYSNESLTLYVNQIIISNSISTQTNYTGNINDTLSLKEDDIIDAQFHCNTTKERIEESCVRTLGFSEVGHLNNGSIFDDVTIFLECNITLGGSTNGLQTVDTEWFIESLDRCRGVAPGFYIVFALGVVAIILIPVVIIIKRIRR